MKHWNEIKEEIKKMREAKEEARLNEMRALWIADMAEQELNA